MVIANENFIQGNIGFDFGGQFYSHVIQYLLKI